MKYTTNVLGSILFTFSSLAFAGECVEKNTDSTRGALNCIEEKIDSTGHGKTGAAVNKTSARAWAECPAGYYVSGIKGVDVDGGKYCSSCISNIEIQCSPL